MNPASVPSPLIMNAVNAAAFIGSLIVAGLVGFVAFILVNPIF
jgi:hypothetical protein